MAGMERALTTQLLSTLTQINRQIEEVVRSADRMGISPHMMRDTEGNWVLSPLLVSKAQTLHALALMNPPKLKEK